ncbi:lactate 2-monooxygenase [Rhodococcus sp. 06-235-1A]|uniref:alpha-hydroxy-acid oxidizing protein n=1 Tax=Rhodococcus sp. 06-235-1A TaxID=2022508 RepID=UPI000B9BB44A|nr:alpha-hydroxy-acid oxidizing protein [Rhodococcus sp. 06-235-1A]OZD06544.1 lactate 2-monooxygenase [Rhodococcus sp. 06-235-1A]
MANYGEYQKTFYRTGSESPTSPQSLPFKYADLERQALDLLDPKVVDYVFGGAGDEHTQRQNVSVFEEKWGIVPRMLNDAADRDLSIEVFGRTFPTPIFLAPIGVIGVMSEDMHGDLAVARAASETGVPMMSATLSMDPLEVVAKEFGGTPGFFQLYTSSDRELTESLVRRVEAAGYTAIALTADTRAQGWRPRDLAQGTIPQYRGLCLETYFSDPVFRSRLSKPPEEDLNAAIVHWMSIFTNPTLSWTEVEWIKSLTKLPVMVKGICHPDDARRSRDAGLDGIYVTNHGGRQVNNAPALEFLPAVVDAADGLPVLFDSGVRSGVDVVKALALGATAVGIGRPYAYGLPIAGTDGVVHVLRSILAETDLTMGINGYARIADLNRDSLIAL